MARITVSRMDRPQYEGDWHDAPLKWRVDGPANEVQKFSTRDAARLYARIRRASPDFMSASNAFVRA